MTTSNDTISEQRTGSAHHPTDAMLTGRCDVCDSWYVLARSYPEIVEKYHRHLRAEHPKQWVRR